MDALRVDAEEGVGDPAMGRKGWVGEKEVQEEGERESEKEANAERVQGGKCVVGPYGASAAGIAGEEGAVLLEDGLVRVGGSPGVVRGAVGVGCCGGDDGARGAWGVG